MNFGIKRALSMVGVAVIGISMLGSATAAPSDNSAVTASVIGDLNAFNLTITSPATFTGSATYNSTSATQLCGNVAFRVEDGTGLNNGWNVQIGTTGDFVNQDIGFGSLTIATSNLTGNPTSGGCPAIQDPVMVSGQAVNGSGCSQANNGQGPLAWVCDANASLSGYGAKVVSTNPGYGNGIYDQITQLKLNVPPATIAGNYTTTITLTLSHTNP